MKTHKLKVTLNEIKRMKQLAGILNEALNKDMKLFGKDLAKYLEKEKFQVKFVSGRLSNEDYAKVKNTMGIVALGLVENPEYQMLTLYYNPKEVKKIDKIVKKFQLSPYEGREFKVDGGWGIKKVIGALNPGDIYQYAKESGIYYFMRTKTVSTKIDKK